MFVVHDDFIFINIERTTLVTILNVKITFCLEASQRAPKTSKDMILAANYYWKALHRRCLQGSWLHLCCHALRGWKPLGSIFGHYVLSFSIWVTLLSHHKNVTHETRLHIYNCITKRTPGIDRGSTHDFSGQWIFDLETFYNK